jgi:hypothetical protein
MDRADSSAQVPMSVRDEMVAFFDGFRASWLDFDGAWNAEALVLRERKSGSSESAGLLDPDRTIDDNEPARGDVVSVEGASPRG